MFKLANFYQVAAGLNLIDKNLLTESLNLNRLTYNNINRNKAIEIFDSVKTSLKTLSKLSLDAHYFLRIFNICFF